MFEQNNEGFHMDESMATRTEDDQPKLNQPLCLQKVF